MIVLTDLVRIALKEHKDDANGIAIAVELYLFVTKQVSRIKSDMDDEMKRHKKAITSLESELAEARKSCPCPVSALLYRDDLSGNNDSYHECRICGKTH